MSNRLFPVSAPSGLTPAARSMVWGVAAALLAIPATAMQFTPEVDWSAGDFIVMGAMLAALCGGIELAARMARSRMVLAVTCLALLGLFLLAWAELAVGIV